MPRRAVGRLVHRVGRRGAVLLLIGGLVLLYGIGQLARPIPDTRGLRLLLMVMDLRWWSLTWVVAGAVAIGCAFARQDRDWPGFTGLWLATIPWALSFFVSWWPLGDNPRGWITSLIFASFGAIPLVIVGWREPPRRAAHREHDEP